MLDSLAINKGYKEGKNYLSVKVEGATHNEAAWELRLDAALEFVLSKK